MGTMEGRGVCESTGSTAGSEVGFEVGLANDSGVKAEFEDGLIVG